MRIVAVVNQKGGVGKTTIAMNLAAMATERGARVLVVDTDEQQSATFWAEQAGERLPFDVATDTDPAHLRALTTVDYDYVFIDAPGSLEGEAKMGATLAVADLVILPVEPAALAIAPLARTVSRHIIPRGVAYKVLLNKTDPRVPADAYDTAKLIDSIGLERFRAHIRDYKVNRTSPIEGTVVTDYSAAHNGERARADFERVATELFEVLAAARREAS